MLLGICHLFMVGMGLNVRKNDPEGSDASQP